MPDIRNVEQEDDAEPDRDVARTQPVPAEYEGGDREDPKQSSGEVERNGNADDHDHPARGARAPLDEKLVERDGEGARADREQVRRPDLPGEDDRPRRQREQRRRRQADTPREPPPSGDVCEPYGDHVRERDERRGGERVAPEREGDCEQVDEQRREGETDARVERGRREEPTDAGLAISQGVQRDPTGLGLVGFEFHQVEPDKPHGRSDHQDRDQGGRYRAEPGRHGSAVSAARVGVADAVERETGRPLRKALGLETADGTRHDVERTPLRLDVRPTDVLADDSEDDQLHTPRKLVTKMTDVQPGTVKAPVVLRRIATKP